MKLRQAKKVFFGERTRARKTEEAATRRLKKWFRLVYPPRHEFWLAS